MIRTSASKFLERTIGLLLLVALIGFGTGSKVEGTGKIGELSSGITHLVGVLSFKTFIDRDKLPTAAKAFAGISVYSNNTPIKAKQKGIEKFAGIPEPYSNAGYSSGGFTKGGTYYVLTILYDAKGKPVAYQETTVKVAGGIRELIKTPCNRPQHLQVTAAITHVVGIKSFKTIVNREKLPGFAKDFTGIGVASLKAPFGVCIAGIDEFVGKSGPYDPTGYASGVPYGRSTYVLTILYNDKGRPVGYDESIIDIPKSIKELPAPPPSANRKLELSTGITHVAGVKSFTTFVNRDKLPNSAKDFVSIGVGSSGAPFAVAQIGIEPFAGSQEPYPSTGTGRGVPRGGPTYVLTILYDAKGKPVGYHETVIDIPDKR